MDLDPGKADFPQDRNCEGGVWCFGAVRRLLSARVETLAGLLTAESAEAAERQWNKKNRFVCHCSRAVSVRTSTSALLESSATHSGSTRPAESRLAEHLAG